MSYNPYRKYCSRWWGYWLNLPKDIWCFIKKMYDYAPLLWEDKDFDYSYLLRMMRFKIRRMRRHMEEHAIIAHAADHIAEMAVADILLRNIEDDPDDEWSCHYGQWDAHIALSEKCKNQKEHFQALKLSHQRDERNWCALWRHLNKYLRGWWE